VPVQLLGKGSFGEVYLVKKKSNNKYYAMKVLSKHRIIQHNLTKYAYTEKNVLSYLRHPFIVSLHCSFQTNDKLFLILDYCPGGDLGRALERDRKFSEDRARIYLAEVLLALEELHNREIIYRDLKPDNVVLDADGHALLTDFGLSKEGVKENDSTQSFCGSVAYLAPEMLRRAGHGKSVDWYLLGVLLYEMLVGMPPYFNRDR
jgi:serine/threonine protein kinase